MHRVHPFSGPTPVSNGSLRWWSILAVPALTICLMPMRARAADPAPAPTSAVPASVPGHKYGFLGLMDNRSQYGKGAFPEPFLVDDSDLEVNELRLDWVHTEARGQGSNEVKAEFEKGFGLATVEVGVHYQRNTARSFNFDAGHSDFGREQGIGNVDLGARSPIFQYVSNDEMIDNTFGAGVEVGIPTNSPVSRNTEVVPKLFNDLRIGEHFTLQTIVGFSFLLGGGEEGGRDAFEYGVDFGYAIQHSELPIPGVRQVVPIFELSGETALNKGHSGDNILLGTAGFRFNLNAIGPVQPRLGIGYVFPMDKGGKDQLRWGFVTSLVFEY